MFPRTHTWLHLLPSDAAFDCRYGPDWLRDPLVQLNSQGGHRVTIQFQRVPEAFGADALVAINCPAISNKDLRDFSDVRRYAVLPGWSNPRWFIPLSNPA